MEGILLCLVTGQPMELAPLGSTPSPDPTSCRWLTRIVQNTVPYVYLPLSSQQGLCMGQFAWIAKAIAKTSVALGGGGGVQGADYVIPNFQLIRYQAESSDWVTIENLSKRACLSGPSALTVRNKHSIAI